MHHFLMVRDLFLQFCARVFVFRHVFCGPNVGFCTLKIHFFDPQILKIRSAAAKKGGGGLAGRAAGSLSMGPPWPKFLHQAYHRAIGVIIYTQTHTLLGGVVHLFP